MIAEIEKVFLLGATLLSYVLCDTFMFYGTVFCLIFSIILFMKAENESYLSYMLVT